MIEHVETHSIKLKVELLATVSIMNCASAKALSHPISFNETIPRLTGKNNWSNTISVVDDDLVHFGTDNR